MEITTEEKNLFNGILAKIINNMHKGNIKLKVISYPDADIFIKPLKHNK